MRKKMMAVWMAAVCIFTLSGCVKADLEEKVSKKGEITDTVILYMEKTAVVDYINRKMGSDRVAEFEKEWLQEGYSIQNIDGMDYYVTKPEVTKSNIVKMAKGNQKEMVKGNYQLWETGMRVDLKLVFDYLGLDSLEDVFPGMEMTEKEKKDVLAKSFVKYNAVFDYDIIRTDKRGVIDSRDPKRAVWNIPLNKLDKAPVIEAYCKSDIKVRGVTQGVTYGKPKKLRFSGVKSAVYKGKKIKSGKVFKKHGQHSIILKAPSGEQRTVTFFIDKKKPKIEGIKNNKTYKKAQYFYASDANSGIASVKVNGKQKKADNYGRYLLKKKGTYRIAAKDNAGNKTKIKIKIKK